MREKCKNILRIYFYNQIIMMRNNMGLTQGQMAELLQMTRRSYADLEIKASCCGAITLILFLIYICEDVDLFLSELKTLFESEGYICPTEEGCQEK